MINLTHGAFRGVFKNWGLILISRKSPVFSCNQLINRFNRHFRSSKRFQKMRINPHFLKTHFFFNMDPIITYNSQSSSSILNPQFLKSDQGLKNASPAPQKLILEAKIILFLLPDIWAKCFLQQKNALNLVKYGRHNPNYDLHLHIGGRHSVLYFTIQVTEKYSNSNVLVLHILCR